jgi:hypothetical protein
MMLMSQKPISKTTSRAVNIIAAMASSILFCAHRPGSRCGVDQDPGRRRIRHRNQRPDHESSPSARAVAHPARWSALGRHQGRVNR